MNITLIIKQFLVFFSLLSMDFLLSDCNPNYLVDLPVTTNLMSAFERINLSNAIKSSGSGLSLSGFEEFMDWRVLNIELPATVLCIIKEHKPNGKIKEHVYQRGYAANRKIKQLILNEQEFTVVDHEGCQQIYPDSLPLYDDPLA